jgi:hypothetical protein
MNVKDGEGSSKILMLCENFIIGVEFSDAYQRVDWLVSCEAFLFAS